MKWNEIDFVGPFVHRNTSPVAIVAMQRFAMCGTNRIFVIVADMHSEIPGRSQISLLLAEQMVTET